LVEDDTGVSHILNPFAACIASDILDDRSIEQIASEISTQAEISIEQARADVTQVATLFASTGSPEVNDPVETLSPSEVTKLFELGAFFPCHVAQLISQQFRIFVDPRLEGMFKKFATLLETADTTTSLHPPQSILCVLRNNRTIVTSDSGQSLSGEHPEMLPSMLFSIMQRSAAARTNHPLALHGAAFSLNGEATAIARRKWKWQKHSSKRHGVTRCRDHY
jgi:hypothetical protein